MNMERPSLTPGTGARHGSPAIASLAALSLLFSALAAAASGAAATLTGGSATGGLAAASGDATDVDGGAHAGGVRHGRWRIDRPGGWTEEGCYVGGLLHGEWVLRDPAGRIVARERWCLGRSAGSGATAGEDAQCGVALPDACRREPGP